MEPHEIKARALVMSFVFVGLNFEQAQKCASITVAETISACEYNGVESHNTDWWKKVDDAIKKL